MRNLVKPAIAAAAIAAGFAIAAPAPAAARSAAVRACRTDASWHPGGIFFVKQCARLHRDGTCTRYTVIICGGRKRR